MKKLLAVLFVILAIVVAVPNMTDARRTSSDGDNTCSKCNGWGDCRTCKGSGYVEEYDGRGHTIEVECEDCRGSGKCSRCKGYGYT